MLEHLRTREEARALFAAALVGGSTGLLLGGAYLVGGMAQAAVQHDQVFRVASVAAGTLSEDALVKAAGEMSPGALAVARRHDPFTVAGAAERDRQAAAFASRLERARHLAGGATDQLLLRASFGGPVSGPAAAPFRLGSALEATRDLDCLTDAVYYEARGESRQGQAAVAQVVLNRVRHPAFPKSVCGVVFQGAFSNSTCQFSFACDGSMRKPRDPEAWTRARDVAVKALNGAVAASVGNATHFHTVYVAPDWGPRMLRVAQLGLHIFYRFGGQAGAANAFSGVPEPSSQEAITRPIYGSSADELEPTADGHTPVSYATSAMSSVPDSAASKLRPAETTLTPGEAAHSTDQARAGSHLPTAQPPI